MRSASLFECQSCTLVGTDGKKNLENVFNIPASFLKIIIELKVPNAIFIFPYSSYW